MSVVTPIQVPPHALPREFNNLTAPLDGYWWETEVIVVPWVASHDPRAFLRWLSGIEAKGKPVFFVTVINPRLDTLLRKRGYVDASTWAAEFGEDALGLLKVPS